MTIATVKYLDVKDFDTLIMKCRKDQVKYAINKSNSNINSVVIFNPNVINLGKWIERFGYSNEVNHLDIRSKS